MRRARELWIGVILCSLLLGICGCNQAVVEHGSEMRAESRVATPAVVPASPQQAVPIRLIIPAIKLDAAIEPVGVLANGDLETPAQHPWVDAGWYTAGPLPGTRGSAVIDGHLDRPGGLPAVFWDLNKLHAGDSVEVLLSSHKTERFHVMRLISYPPQQAPLQEIFGNGGGTYLNLITCAGYWIPAQQQTALRLVVYTVQG